MNENEAARIAAAINQLRPDWPVRSLLTLISTRLAERPRRDVAVALAWVACESDSTTPARVLEAGPWWPATNIDGHATRRPPKPHEECGDHPGEYRLGCRLHAADLKARREERWGSSSSRLTREQAIQAMRDNLAASQGRLDAALNRTPQEPA